MKYKVVLIASVFFCFYSCSHSSNRYKVISDVPETIKVSSKQDTYSYFLTIDTNYSRYCLPDSFIKPIRWIKADKEKTKGLGYGAIDNYPDVSNLNDALNIIDTAIVLANVRQAKSWCIINYKEAFPYLVARLSYKQKIGSTETADLIIAERIGTGDLKFYGHGGGINEDIFTVAGRASWILNLITGETFAEVHADLTPQDANRFKGLWVEYLMKLKKR